MPTTSVGPSSYVRHDASVATEQDVYHPPMGKTCADRTSCAYRIAWSVGWTDGQACDVGQHVRGGRGIAAA